MPRPCRISAIIGCGQDLLGGGFAWFAGRELLRLFDRATGCAVCLTARLGLLEHVLFCHFGCRDEQLAFLRTSLRPNLRSAVARLVLMVCLWVWGDWPLGGTLRGNRCSGLRQLSRCRILHLRAASILLLHLPTAEVVVFIGCVVPRVERGGGIVLLQHLVIIVDIDLIAL